MNEAFKKDIPSKSRRSASPTILYVRPLWPLAESGFRKVWEDLISEKRSSERGSLLKNRILADRSVVFATNGIARSINKARHVLSFLNRRPDAVRMPIVPVQIVIDTGMPAIVEGMESLGTGIDGWEMEPGEIYATPAAYSTLHGTENLSFAAHPSKKLYRLMDSKRRAFKSPVFFPFGAAMFQGADEPCFYCGLRHHQSGRCPTKMRDGRPGALERLGYCSPVALNHLFLGCLLGNQLGNQTGNQTRNQAIDQAENGIGHGPGEQAREAMPYEMAAEAVMELFYIHQLRFFSLLWNVGEERWENVRSGRSLSNGRRGGRAWLAFDCVRSANHARAEALIEKALEKSPHEFNLHCIKGYLHIERKDRIRAAEAFGTAFMMARTNPQRIFIHFILFRLCSLDGDFGGAREHLDEILSIDPECRDAVYYAAVLSFERGESRQAAENLLVLIQADRRYFVRALIDPELASFHHLIDRRLGRLYEQARETAEKGIEAAESEMERLKKLLGEEDRFVGEMASSLKKARGLHASHSYFGYLDAGRTAKIMVAAAQREIARRGESIFQVLSELDEYALTLFDDVKILADSAVIRLLYAELKAIRENIDAVRKDVRLEQSTALVTAPATNRRIAENLKAIRSKVEFRKNLGIVRIFAVTFSKVNLIFQPINLLVGVILLPLTVRYLLSGIEGVDISGSGFRLCQVCAVFFGGAAGIIFALMKGLSQIREE